MNFVSPIRFVCSVLPLFVAHRAPLRRRTESGALPCEGRVASPRSNRSRLFSFSLLLLMIIFHFQAFLCLHVHCRASGLSQFQSPPYWLAVFFRSRVNAAIATRPVFVLAPASFGSDDWRAALCHCGRALAGAALCDVETLRGELVVRDCECFSCQRSIASCLRLRLRDTSARGGLPSGDHRFASDRVGRCR